MFCVGLTGNIGSGKSTALALFNTLGANVIKADEVSRALTLPTQPAFKLIVDHFGVQAVNQQGQLDRAYLRSIIFADKAQKRWLEQLLHPLIRAAIETELSASQGSYTIIEIPLLTARHHYPYLDIIIAIFAPKDVQIKRIMARDACSKEQALAILATQPSDKLRRQVADSIIMNTGSLAELNAKILPLHHKFLHLAATKGS